VFKWIIPCLSLGMITGTSVFGLISDEIDTTRAIECTFSSVQQNRIAVNQGRVKKVICPDGFFIFTMEPDSGQAFLFPLRQFKEKVTMSVITSSGEVQDLVVSLEEKPSEVVILYEKGTLYEDEEVTASDPLDTMVDVVKMILNGGVPPGYVARPGKRVSPQRIPSNLSVGHTLVLDGPFETVYAFEVINESRKALRLDQEDFKIQGDRWVFIKDETLNRRGSTLVMVGVTR
jgi:hypothetical protein